MNYFERPEISVSDIKHFLKRIEGGAADPLNLQQIFAMGTTFHETILEPYKLVDRVIDSDYALAQKMKDTFYKDEFCRNFVMGKDFEREREDYNTIQVGGYEYSARCKSDGIRPGIKTILELKGLSITTKSAFEASIERLNYDLAAVHYLLTAKCEMIVIVGISKVNPRLLFKKIIKKNDEIYAWGEEKLRRAISMLSNLSPDDIKKVA